MCALWCRIKEMDQEQGFVSGDSSSDEEDLKIIDGTVVRKKILKEAEVHCLVAPLVLRYYYHYGVLNYCSVSFEKVFTHYIIYIHLFFACFGV